MFDDGYKLFLDDLRYPETCDGWVIARTFDDAVWYVLTYGLPDCVSFDHDLGLSDSGEYRKTGMDFAKWLCEYIMDTGLDVTHFSFYVHSWNPVGAKNIHSYMTQFLKTYKNRE